MVQGLAGWRLPYSWLASWLVTQRDDNGSGDWISLDPAVAAGTSRLRLGKMGAAGVPVVPDFCALGKVR